MIVLESLFKKYNDKVILNSVSWNFGLGKIHGIIGANGVGKSTLFKCMVGLEDFEGNIFYHENIARKKIAYLPTEPFFFERITGNEYLKFIAQSRKIPAQNLEEFNVFDLPLDQYASSYSTGMKKKLALMGLLMDDFDVYILDEPFNGVDIESNILIEGIIETLSENNKTIFLSSHIISILTEICQEIHVLNDGKFEKTVIKSDFNEFQIQMKDQIKNEGMKRLGLFVK
ncbi:MAG: ATP-binding cassette domain-containing protein [Mongoliitalea sp.]